MHAQPLDGDVLRRMEDLAHVTLVGTLPIGLVLGSPPIRESPTKSPPVVSHRYRCIGRIAENRHSAYDDAPPISGQKKTGEPNRASGSTPPFPRTPLGA